MEKKNIVFQSPLTPTLMKLKETLLLEENLEIYEVSNDLQEQIQLIFSTSPALWITSSVKNIIQLLANNHQDFKKCRSKMILISLLDLTPKIVSKLNQVGVKDIIYEPIATKNLMYKMNLLIKAIPSNNIQNEQQNNLQKKYEQNNNENKDIKKNEFKSKISSLSISEDMLKEEKSISVKNQSFFSENDNQYQNVEKEKIIDLNFLEEDNKKKKVSLEITDDSLEKSKSLSLDIINNEGPKKKKKNLNIIDDSIPPEGPISLNLIDDLDTKKKKIMLELSDDSANKKEEISLQLLNDEGPAKKKKPLSFFDDSLDKEAPVSLDLLNPQELQKKRLDLDINDDKNAKKKSSLDLFDNKKSPDQKGLAIEQEDERDLNKTLDLGLTDHKNPKKKSDLDLLDKKKSANQKGLGINKKEEEDPQKTLDLAVHLDKKKKESPLNLDSSSASNKHHKEEKDKSLEKKDQNAQHSIQNNMDNNKKIMDPVDHINKDDLKNQIPLSLKEKNKQENLSHDKQSDITLNTTQSKNVNLYETKMKSHFSKKSHAKQNESNRQAKLDEDASSLVINDSPALELKSSPLSYKAPPPPELFIKDWKLIKALSDIVIELFEYNKQSLLNCSITGETKDYTANTLVKYFAALEIEDIKVFSYPMNTDTIPGETKVDPAHQFREKMNSQDEQKIFLNYDLPLSPISKAFFFKTRKPDNPYLNKEINRQDFTFKKISLFLRFLKEDEAYVPSNPQKISWFRKIIMFIKTLRPSLKRSIK